MDESSSKDSSLEKDFKKMTHPFVVDECIKLKRKRFIKKWIHLVKKRGKDKDTQ